MAQAARRLCASNPWPWSDMEGFGSSPKFWEAMEPGGVFDIVIWRGALELLSDTQLAGLLAHELGHVRAGAVVGLMYMRFALLPLLWPWYAAGALYWVWANLLTSRKERYVTYAEAVGWAIGLV